MAIEIASSFGMKAQLPLDERYVVADQTARDAIDSGVRYEGLQVYVEADEKVYILKGGITNGDWIELGSSEMVGATDSVDGESGTVPQPLIGDEEKYLRGDGAWEKPPGGAGSGGINLESSPYAQDGDNDWDVMGSVSASETPDDDSILSGEFVGTYNIIYPASDRENAGRFKHYTISQSDRDRGYLAVSFRYSPTIDLAHGDFRVEANDPDNSVALPIRGLEDGELPAVKADKTGKVSFLVDLNSDTTRVTISIHRNTDDATALTFKYSDIRIGPPSQLVVPPTVKYLGALTTTGTWSTNTTYTGKYWREADKLRGQVFIALTGAPDNVALTISLPNGLSVNTDRLTVVSTGATDVTVSGMYLDSGAGNGDAKVFLDTSDKTKLHIRAQNDAAAESNRYATINQTSPIVWENNDSILVTYEVPIEGWENSSNIVDVAELGIKTAKVLLTSDDQPSIGTSATKITFNNVISDNLALYVGGKFTAPSRMAVDIMGLLTTDSETWAAGNSVAVRAYVNGEQRHIIGIKRFETAVTQGADVSISATIDLEKGDELEIFASSSVATNILNSATSNLLSIQARPDLTAIAAIAGQEDYKTATLASTSATALTSNVSKTVISLSLPAGVWDVWGWVGYMDASGTTTQRLKQSISTTTNTLDGNQLAFPYTSQALNTAGAGVIQLPAERRRLTLTTTTTVYLVAYALFAVNTMSAYGTIKAKGRLRA